MNMGIKLNQMIESDNIIGIHKDFPDYIKEIERFYFFNMNGMNIFYYSDLEDEINIDDMIDYESKESFIKNNILPKYEELKSMIDSDSYYFRDNHIDNEFSISDDNMDSLDNWIKSRDNQLFDSLSQLEYLIEEYHLI